MGADIPDTVTTLMRSIARSYNAEVYLAGGALCDRPTNDYDLVILTPETQSETLRIAQEIYTMGLCTDISVYEAYKDEDKFHTKAVTQVGPYKVDLLFADSTDYDIDTIMDEFPLSVQMRYWTVGANQVNYGDKFSREPILVFRNFPDCTAKYKKYYPDRQFLEVFNEDS